MSFSVRKKAILKWGNDRLWHRWPVMIWPLVKEFKVQHDYYPNLLRPRSLNEKILYRMLFDRRAHMPSFTGKLESRDVVRERLGNENALIPLIGAIYKPEDIARINFPSRFIMKANHGSAMTYLHNEDTPPDLDHLKELCREWLAYDFAKYRKEWCYKLVKRAVVVEELLTDAQGEIPKDYKFYCFDGVPRFIKMYSARFTDHKTSDMFDAEWRHIPGQTVIPSSDEIPAKPVHLREMLAMAATLSKGVDFVRVDLYDTGTEVKFGELTNTPSCASYIFDPPSLDYEFGKYWKISVTRKVQNA